MNVKIGLEALVAFVAAYALCIGIAPVVTLSPMFVGIGAALAYFVYQRMSIEEYEYYYETDEEEDEKTYSAPPETLLDAYERSSSKAQNNVLENLWRDGSLQDFLQMKGYSSEMTASAATSAGMAEINDEMFDFDDASDSAVQEQNEDGLISPIVDETPARPNMATAIDEDDFDLFDDELEEASIPPATAPTVDDSADDLDEMLLDDSLLDEDDDDDELLPEEPEKKD